MCVCFGEGGGGGRAGLRDTTEQCEVSRRGQAWAERNPRAPVFIWLGTPRTKATLCLGQATVDERPCLVQQDPGTEWGGDVEYTEKEQQRTEAGRTP